MATIFFGKAFQALITTNSDGVRGQDCTYPANPFQAARVAFAWSGVFARFLQKFCNDSVPPNNVVNMVESANTMSPARSPSGGIQSSILNSRFPSSVNGCGRDISIGCRARTWIDLVSSVVKA